MFRLGRGDEARGIRRFEQGLASFEILAPGMVRNAAMVIVLLESLVAVCLLAGWARVWGTGVAVVLLAVFAVALASARRRGVPAMCACFGGTAGDLATPRTYVRLALLGFGVALVIFDAQASTVVQVPFSGAALVAAGCVTVGCAALTVASETVAVVLDKSRSPSSRLGRR